MAKLPKKKESVLKLAKMAYHGKNYEAKRRAAEAKRKKKEKERREREALRKKGSVLGQTRDNKLDEQMGDNKADIYKKFGK